MNNKAFSFPGRFIKNRLLIKLVLVYSTIMIVPLLLTIYMITEHVNAKMIELEISKQDELTNKMSHYMEEQSNKIRNIVFWFYDSEDAVSTVDMLTDLSNNESAFPAYVIKNRISSELNKIVHWDKEILDIILINKEKDVISTSKRSISVGYNFTKNAPLVNLKPSDKHMYKYSFNRLDYILDSNIPVISHAGNLYNLNNLPGENAVGQYMINLSSNEIMNNYRQFAGTINASLYIFDDDGTVLFSNVPQSIGQPYPFLDQIADLTTHEPKLAGETYILNKSDLNQDGLHIVVQTPIQTITKDTNALIRQILAIFFSGVLVVLILTLSFSTNISSKIKRLLTAMRQVEKGNFSTHIHLGSKDELGQLTAAFNRMCVRLKAHVDMVYLAEIKTKSAELSALQSRINPHFLLNTIESIRMKAVEQQAPEISNMLYMLGRLFHWKVRSNDLIITVEEELEYISSYLLLLQFRFQDQLDVKISIEEDMHELGIPKLLLQPIIENASQHGLFHKDQQARLFIRGYREEHKAVFDIMDNGIGMDDSKLQQLAAKMDETDESEATYQIGLSNVQQRIRILFGESYGLEVASKKDYWTRIRVTIPAIIKKEMEALVPDFYR